MSATPIRCIALFVLSWGGLSACHSEHMNPRYGQQSRLFLARQHVNSTAAQGSPSGLDSEESALIKASYRRSLGEQERDPGGMAGSRVLLVKDDDVPKKK